MIILKNLFSNKIYVDAFCKEKFIVDAFPISRMNKHIPEWFKQLPSEFYQNANDGLNRYQSATIKRCPGFVEFYKKGFTIPLWSDVTIASFVNPDEKRIGWAAHSPSSSATLAHHHPNQLGPAFDNYFHLKFNSPWACREKTGVNFLLTSISWSSIDLWDKIYTAQGILNFKHQPSTNINCFIHRKNYDFILEAGTPMVGIFPLTEKEVEFKCHHISEEEWKKVHDGIAGSQYFFLGGYHKSKEFLGKNKK